VRRGERKPSCGEGAVGRDIGTPGWGDGAARCRTWREGDRPIMALTGQPSATSRLPTAPCAPSLLLPTPHCCRPTAPQTPATVSSLPAACFPPGFRGAPRRRLRSRSPLWWRSATLGCLSSRAVVAAPWLPGLGQGLAGTSTVHRRYLRSGCRPRDHAVQSGSRRRLSPGELGSRWLPAPLPRTTGATWRPNRLLSSESGTVADDEFPGLCWAGLGSAPIL